MNITAEEFLNQHSLSENDQACGYVMKVDELIELLNEYADRKVENLSISHVSDFHLRRWKGKGVPLPGDYYETAFEGSSRADGAEKTWREIYLKDLKNWEVANCR